MAFVISKFVVTESHCAVPFTADRHLLARTLINRIRAMEGYTDILRAQLATVQRTDL